jgi:hypothetical protein
VAGLNRLGCEVNAGIYKNQSLFGGGGLDKEGRFLGERGNFFIHRQRPSFGIEPGGWKERWKDFLLSVQYVV